MNNTSHYISKNFSAPVVQSRLKHHHELLSKPEVRTQHQHQHQHQKSKPLSNNKGKKSPHQQKLKETTTFTSPPSPFTASTSFSDNTNRRNFNNFDSSYHREQSVGYNNNNLVENGSQLQRKTSTSNRPLRRHQYSGSVDEGKSAPSILILKRPQSATDFVRSNNNAKSSDVTHEEHQNNHRLRSNNNNNNKFGEKSPQRSERRRSDVTHSRSKRPQRKEVKSMELDTDLVLNNIQQLSNESDVNSNNKYAKSVSSSSHNININNNNNNNTTTTTTTSQTINAVMFPPLNYSNAIIALEEEMNSNKKEDKEDTYSISDDNITFKSSLNKKRSDNYAETTPRRLSSTAIELQNQVSRFADFDSDSDSLSSARRGLNSSPGRLGGTPKLYAGPTFHNSPAPSDLPMPSFYGKSLGKDQSPLSTNLFTVPENPPSLIPSYDNYSSPSSGNTSDDDIFAMDDVETPASRKQKSRELLRILAGPNIRQNHTAAAYMVPERMATAHNPTKVYPTNDLNEISENLRSLLKIHGQ